MSEDLNKFEYKDEGNGQYTLTGVKDKKAVALDIPEGVTSFGFGALGGCKGLKSLSLPASFRDYTVLMTGGLTELESITVAEDNPYFRGIDGCLYRKSPSGLTLLRYPPAKVGDTLVLPEEAFEVDNLVFNDSRYLKRVVLHKGVSRLQGRSFLSPTVAEVTLPEDNPCYILVNGAILTRDGSKLVCYPTNRQGGEYSVPDGVTVICDGAFMRNANITSLTLPEGLRELEYDVFRECSRLATVSLPDSLRLIGSGAFYMCVALSTIAIPEGVSKIERTTFLGCSSLAELTLPENLEVIDEYAFRFCNKLTRLTLPAGLRRVGDGAFDKCGITEVEYALDSNLWDSIEFAEGNGVLLGAPRKYLGEAFSKDSFMDEENLCEIMSAFEYEKDGDRLIIKKIKDSETVEVHIPYGVTDIGDEALVRCFDLRSIAIPDTVRRIGNEAFLSCKSLESAEIPEGVESIGERAFGCCDKLSRVELPSTLTTLGHAPFWSCESLVEIAVDPANVALSTKDGNLYSHDGSTLIQYCVGKPETAFSIPDGVRVIGERAFECSRLTEVIFNGSEREIGVCAFCNCFYITALEIPSSVRIFRESAFSYCTRLESVSVPGNVDIMEGDLFSHCNKLTRGAISRGSNTLDRCPLWCCEGIEELTLPSEIRSITTMSLMSGGSRSGFSRIRFLGDKKQWKALLKSLDNGTVKLIKKSKILF